MNDNDRHVLTLFSAALECGTASDRESYLDEACAGDPGLRERVEALLRFHEKAGGFLGANVTAPFDSGAEPGAPEPGATASYESSAEGLGETIGRYRLLQEIGEGGMGTVYMAEQIEPVKRMVALKVIKPGMDSRQVLARFEAERQALAMMDHPNIARVLDAGTTKQGRPYFVMELVKGVPITTFCDERKLSPRERIELFVAVCQAVQHAHQKGIIHRDLKPSNVLVALYDDTPVPKVIDFGIAKATGARLTDQTVFTQFGAIVGTLNYMSPEQAQFNQLDVDTRSDVYSLGVLLYELLTGSTPLGGQELGQAALLDMLKMIREAETPRPSLRLSTSKGLPTIAANRGLEPRKLSGLIRGDLDWIVMKALEKDRKRRYETANALARDLQRFLSDENVEATPPSAGYRLRKFARRHRVALSVGLIVTTALVAATAFSSWQAVRATRAKRIAVESAEIERVTKEFFISDLLAMSSVTNQMLTDLRPDPDIKVRTLVDRAAEQIDGRFGDQPRLEAAVRGTIGDVYRSLGLFEQARPFLERAHEILNHQLGPEHRDTIASLIDLGGNAFDRDSFSEAEARLREALTLAIQSQGEDSSLTAHARQELGSCLRSRGRFEEAEVLQRQALEYYRRGVAPSDALRAIGTRIELSSTLGLRGKEAEAEALIEETLGKCIQTFGEDHPLTPEVQLQLAGAQRRSGRFAQAELIIRKALESRSRLLGPSHQLTLSATQTLAILLRDSGRMEEAEETLRSALETARETYGPESGSFINAAVLLAEVLSGRNSQAEAEAMLLAVREPARRISSILSARVECTLGQVYTYAGRYPEAIRAFQSVEERATRSPVFDSRTFLGAKINLAVALMRSGLKKESIAMLRETLVLSEKTYGADDPTTFLVMRNLAEVSRGAGLLDEAEALYPRVIALGQRIRGPDHGDVQQVLMDFGALLHVRGRFEQAEAQYRAAYEGLRRTWGPDDDRTLICRSNLGELYRDWGKPDQGEPLLKEALKDLERVLGPDNTLTLWPLWKLAEMDRDRGRYEEAEAAFTRCLEGYDKAQPKEGQERAMLRADLAMNFLKKGEAARAEALLREVLGVFDKHYPDHWRRYEIQSLLGEALADQEKYAEAEPLLESGHEGLTAHRAQVTADAWGRLPESGQRLVRLYDAWGKPEEANRWRERLLEKKQDKPVQKAKPEAGVSSE